MSYQEMWRSLAQVYDEGEAKAISRMVYEVRFGLTFSDICIGKDTQLSADLQAECTEITRRLLLSEPVQYVLGQCDFCGRSFHVEPGVLIPRSETAELCQMITRSSATLRQPTILDMGTGSGCIAITLALELPGSRVTAWDISPVALRIAADNADRLGADVLWMENDMLKQPYNVSPQWDIIVSNPPYICDSEAAQMDANVLEHEPEMALFVPDDDPLLFYRPIMNYAQSALFPGGMLWLETNPLYEEHIEDNLLELGFEQVEVIDDAFGKPRFIKAQR